MLCPRPRSLTLSLIPGKLFPTSSGSWSDFYYLDHSKSAWLVDWLNDLCATAAMRRRANSLWPLVGTGRGSGWTGRAPSSKAWWYRACASTTQDCIRALKTPDWATDTYTDSPYTVCTFDHPLQPRASTRVVASTQSFKYQYKYQYLSLKYQYQCQYPCLKYKYKYQYFGSKYQYQYKYPVLQPWRQRYWNIGRVAGRAPKTRESRRRRRRGEWGLGRGCAPSQKKIWFFSSENGVIWCISGCVDFKIHVSREL